LIQARRTELDILGMVAQGAGLGRVPGATMAVMTASGSIDYRAMTAQQRDTWALGDFNVIAMVNMPIAERMIAEIDPRPGQRLLDIACGSGNVALVAARRHVEAHGIDYVPALVERARQRAAADGVAAEFREADAQALPFPDEEFDHACSVFGVMFAPHQERAARELLRVVKRGGTIAMASWTPDDFGGDFFRAVSKYGPPADPLLPLPSRWGTADGLRALIGDGVREIANERQTYLAYFRSIDHAIDLFVRWFGPLVRLWEGLDDAGRAALRADLAGVFAKYNRAGDGTLAAELGYLRTIARKR
jgi:ubiquinone/menaquinone biosynthesis C-methylase UbiE